MMKNLKWITLLSCLIASHGFATEGLKLENGANAFSLKSYNAARGGSDVGNGGDAYSLEFVGFGQSLLVHWDDLQLSPVLKITKDDFASAIQRAHISSTSDPLYVGKSEVDAKNFPFCTPPPADNSIPCGEIVFNRDRWDTIHGDPIRKMSLVLHEYLGVLGTNGQRFDDFYQITSQALAPLKSILENQKRVDVNFSCSISGWDTQKNSEYVIATVDTYENSAPRIYISVPRKYRQHG